MGRLQRMIARQLQQHNTPVPQESSARTAVPMLDTSNVVDLQRLIGNQGVQRLLADNPGFLQAKLTVGAADDAYEREADSVASQVMQNANANMGVQREGEEEELAMKRLSVQRDAFEEEEPLQAKRIQRESEEDELQMKRLPSIQREGEEEELALKRIQRETEDEELQMKRLPTIQRAGPFEDDLMAKRDADIMRAEKEQDLSGSFDVTSDIESQISQNNGGGQAMPDHAQRFFESGFGHDFSNVNVHTDSGADTLNQSLGARAFTTGNDIYFRSGEYNPDSSGGKELLAHELTHVVQQTGGNPVQAKRDECDHC